MLAIPENQALAVGKRWLISGFKSQAEDGLNGTFWGISSARESYKQPDGSKLTGGYSKKLATEVIGCIRTDLDAFSDAEAAVLENHGYWLADAGIYAHLTTPLRPDPYPALDIPHPDYVQEDKVRSLLADVGRGPSWDMSKSRWRFERGWSAVAVFPFM